MTAQCVGLIFKGIKMGKVLEFYVELDEVLSDEIINQIKEYNKQVRDLREIGILVRKKVIKYAQENMSIPKIIYSKYSNSPSVTLQGGSLEEFKRHLKIEIKNMIEEEPKPKPKNTMAAKSQRAGIDPVKILNSSVLTKDQKMKIIREILEG